MQEPIIGLAATIKLKEEKKEGSEAKQKHGRTQLFFFLNTWGHILGELILLLPIFSSSKMIIWPTR